MHVHGTKQDSLKPLYRPKKLSSLTCLSSGMDGDMIVSRGFDYWINILQDLLDRKLGHHITERKRTEHSSQFKYDGELEVDMLASPFWREPNSLYSFLQRISSEHWPK